MTDGLAEFLYRSMQLRTALYDELAIRMEHDDSTTAEPPAPPKTVLASIQHMTQNRLGRTGAWHEYIAYDQLLRAYRQIMHSQRARSTVS